MILTITNGTTLKADFYQKITDSSDPYSKQTITFTKYVEE